MRHSFCSRLLFTVFPSQCYAKKDKSIFGLLEALTADCKELFENGLQESKALKLRFTNLVNMTVFEHDKTPIQVQYDDRDYKLRFAYLGGKGDWVWLRKAFALAPGWSSKRICHLCDQEDLFVKAHGVGLSIV